MEIELPFKAEYAKTGRAGCKGCKTNIGHSTLRIAAMVQSAFSDNKQPNWYHEACFFKKLRPSSAGDISNFENLRFEDQERLRKQIAEVAFVVTAGGAKGGKRTKTADGAVKDFGIEYAKSGRALCRGCEQKIIKDVVRVQKTVYDSEVGMKYGGQPLWHHVECFAQLRNDLGWLASGECLPGYNTLKSEDQKIVKKALPAIKAGDVPDAKKAKLEPKTEKDQTEDAALQKKIAEQSKRLFEFRDKVKERMSRADILELLEDNGQEPVVSDSEKLLNQVADMLTFGAIAPCNLCKGQQMLFDKSGYLCNGELTEWTKCSNVIKEPKRKACQISSELKQSYKFLKGVAKKPEIRAIRYIPPSVNTISKNIAINKDETEGPKVKRERPALYNLTFSYIGIKDAENLKKRVMKLGGKLISKINEATVAVFSNEMEVERMGNRMQQAKQLGLHILPIEYIDEVSAKPQAIVQYINSMSLCDWGTDPQARLPQAEKYEAKSIYEKSVPKKITLKVKDGLAVDPECGLEDSTHVYVEKKDKYNVVLGLTDIQRNKNSYYKIQLLEDERKQKYYVFRSWGRIGTTIGSNMLEDFSTLCKAKQKFCEVYADKTGNDFSMREHFQKVPGRMYPIDIDYSEDIKIDENEHNVESKLQPELRNLIKLMFDIENMKRTMLEFHLDMEKMPLGKLSQKQMQSAYKVLTEIYELIQKSASNASFIDATNRFYTLIPHNFGVRAPPLLDTTEQIEKLRQMLDSLMEIECAYNMIKTEDDQKDLNPVDRHYEQLKTKMDVLPKDGDEFKLLEQYVQNTHAETHNMYNLEVVDIFKVARQGEARRYKPFKKLHNRKLLWHGSRLTNFAGILSHGLKIAPPEAPVTGYMFGKGIYFADMVSKSANYCCTSKQNNTGLLLLSEVALGDMLECTNAKYITQLPKDKHSCFGMGRTQPNPAESIMREDNVEIPMGRPITNDKLKTSLLYNEYIVYDIAQVNIQYLFRVNFNYKY